MLTIYAKTELHDQILKIIHVEDRLDEIVHIMDLNPESPSSDSLTIRLDETGFSLPLFWDNSVPPYLLPQHIPFTQENLLGVIFHLLENDQKSWQYLNGTSLYTHLENQNRLKYGLPFPTSRKEGSSFIDLHNQAVINHYGVFQSQDQFHHPAELYTKALEQAPDDEHLVFTLKELSTFYLDSGQLDLASKSLDEGIQKAISEEAKQALNLILVKVWMQQLVVPYDEALIERLKTKIWETLNFYEKGANQAQVGLLLLDATHIANISDSYSEALGYIKRAIDIFEEEGFDELAGSAILRKGTLLYTWAQQGNPQFYKPAVEAYQKALYTFSKEAHPNVFADIHQNLAGLYAEMPSDPQRKSIWAGVASASFNEALEYYTKDQFPYQYGSICNNYGNALMKFPAAVHTDNYEKAIQYYGEALSVRTAEYPYERAITLLNYLEASWSVGNDPEVFNYMRYEDMLKKANEVKTLVQDPDMIQEAEKHLESLKKLKEVSK